MPSLGADMEEGKLIEWLVKPGDRVAKGDTVAVVETQKGAIEIEIFEAGVIGALLAQPGQTLPVGAPLARLGAVEITAPATSAEPSTEVAKAVQAPACPPAPTPAVPPPAIIKGSALASPAARARAAELGLRVEAVAGSGPGGAVLLADVERDAQAPPAIMLEPARSRPQGKPGLNMIEMRRAIAAAMSRANLEIPHYYLSHEIDLQAARGWLAAQNAHRTPDRRFLMSALLIRAVVRALVKVPELNGRFEAEPFAASTAVNCGLAVAMRGGGLIAPALLEAQDMDLDVIMEAMRDIVARTRTGLLRNSEITRGTVTVSSLGESGVDALFGVIYPPQVALVGFGTPRLRPMVREGRVEPRLGMTATLAADHRVSDGRRGALFLAEIDRLLQEPEQL